MMGAVPFPKSVLHHTRPRNLLLKSVIIAALILIAARSLLTICGSYIQLPVLLQQSVPTAKTCSNPSKIGKIFMQYGPLNPINERGLSTHTAHNENFGYSVSLLRNETMPKYWSKPAYIMKVLLDEMEKPDAERLQWVFWFDSDIVLMNPKIPLEIFLPPEDRWSHIHAVVAQDHRGLNNGVFGLRVHRTSVYLMAATLSITTYLPDMKLKIGDQSALEYWVQSDRFRKSIMHVPQRWFNAYAGYRGNGDVPDPDQPQRIWQANSIKEGDLLVHHAGNKPTRDARMEPWLKAAERRLPRWEVDLANTTYPEEVKQFWEVEAPKEWGRVEKFRKVSNYQY